MAAFNLLLVEAAAMDEPPPTPALPLISDSKHNRIVIWRDEVVSASASYAAASNYSAPSLITTTTASSTSLSPSELATMSRSSRLWYKVKTQFTGKRRSSVTAANADVPEFMMPPRKGDVTRTAMYQNLRSGDTGDDEVVPGQESNGRGRGLWEKQKRLLRASKLLSQHH
ncbi:uncharacterized protein TRIVIDRAFT_207986 [Trichoderma virens Gv29-8]|uniref:Uncharacterized protein n=1 Tax=Hypocrea virens (strain Gv29-8 / FGSC 10586) TaxID=413071 RepID=G9MI04_HYPVG|nr:uncharacterized protein TRIVIDRAFT_207986 [Trichoderma virens Gv29-8]EHK26339.1 hypothetical protein TRIVIDRAFT_207986 [Trichoderma virens Gv29-8]UKZ46521.1 hypothetical protein TrVGV298_000726 [Trichoderma virens]